MRRPLHRWALVLTCSCLLMPGCETPEDAALRSNALGVAYMNLQQMENALAAFQRARELDPSLVEAQLNEGIALYNLNRYEEAEQVLRDLVAKQPDNVRAWYNLGLLYRNTGRFEQGEMAFTEAVRIDPRDADSWYFLGLMRFSLQDYDGAIEAYDQAISLNPFHYSAEFGLFNALARTGRVEEAQAHNDRRVYLEAENLGVPIGTAYGDQGAYSFAVDARTETAPASEPIAVRFRATDDIDFTHTRDSGETTASFLGSGACFLDADGDGRADLFLANGGSPSAIFGNRNGRFEPMGDTLPPLPSGATGCAAGDFDNDLDTDLAIGFAGGVRLLENDGAGAFTDVSDAAGVVSETATLGLTFIDFDHDGDLDLYASQFANGAWNAASPLSLPDSRLNSGNVLWRNNGDGTFTDWTQETGLAGVTGGIGAVASDINNDRAIDFVTSGWDRAPEIFLNPREGEFQAFDWNGAAPPPAAGIAVLDFDQDSWMDLALTHWGAPGLTLWRNVDGLRFEPVALPDTGWDRGWGVTPIDYDNDGWIDLAAAGETGSTGQIRVFRNRGAAGFEDVSATLGLAELEPVDPRALVTADTDLDGDADLVLTRNGGPALLLENDGGNRNAWIGIALEGLNDNRSGIGTKVEVFAGAHHQKSEIQSGSGYLGQNALPLTAGLGDNAPVDTVRMLWPTGVFQDEIGLAVDDEHPIQEIDRRGSSCPVLFAWDGDQYAFITDVIGAGVVGHWIGPGQRNVSDPTEYVRVAGSAVSPKDGRLSFRLVEPMEELVYLDQVRLLAIDHPADVETYPHEYFAAAPPFPGFGIIASRDARLPAAALDSNGDDVLEDLRAIDGRYVTGFDTTAFRGFAPTHTLELDLGPIDTAGPVRLLMHGFVDYFSATSIFAAHQAGVEAVLPYVEAQAPSGEWIRVMDDLGFPAGLPRTMARDLTGRLPDGTRRIRITTNLVIYWDQILIDTTPAGLPVRVSEVPLATATLDFLGYPKAESGTLPSDVRYVYDEVSPTGPYARHAGDYTRFGEVTPLLGNADDLYAIFGSGEEVALEFDPSTLPPPEEGWTRDYFFYADGFSKDMDFYEAHASTVGPLPFHTDEPYPYASGARYPTSGPYLEYLFRYNTRPSSGGTQPAYRFEYPE